jgi:xanthine dehydrogenase accessory factor
MKTASELSVIIKGAGEMASGIAHRLYQAGIRRIAMTEIERPVCVRRFVSFCEAVHDGSAEVEGVTARRAMTSEDIASIWNKGEIAVIVDPEGKAVTMLSPDVVIDAIMAKRNLGTRKTEASFVIGVGPGFEAPRDVHAVIESNRGHDLGRVFYDGSAEPYTGIPGEIKGLSKERVLRAPKEGHVRHVHALGDDVKEGDLVLTVGDVPVYAPFDGIVRGLIREIDVDQFEKVGDIDPRARKNYCYTISEKARAIAGGVLEAIMHEFNGK